jgi:hypothetical protein
MTAKIGASALAALTLSKPFGFSRGELHARHVEGRHLTALDFLFDACVEVEWRRLEVVHERNPVVASAFFRLKLNIITSAHAGW